MYPKASVLRLYDMKNDPLEIRDLADEEQFDKTITELLVRFWEMQKVYGDTMRLDNIYTGYLE